MFQTMLVDQVFYTVGLLWVVSLFSLIIAFTPTGPDNKVVDCLAVVFIGASTFLAGFVILSALSVIWNWGL